MRDPLALRNFDPRPKVLAGAAALGALGLIATAAGYPFDPLTTLHSYLVAFSYWAGLAVASLILLATFHASNARWMTVIRRTLETLSATAPLFGVLFIPIALGAHRLYPWAGSVEGLSEEARKLFEHKHAYLNLPFFVARSALYFAVWIGVSLLLRRWSLRQDESTPSEAEALIRKQRRLAAGSLPFLALTITFASVDWLMSLEPEFFSTAFGAYYFAGAFVGAIALCTAVTVVARGEGLPGEWVTGAHLHNLGKLLLAFTGFWAYIAYSQYMLIWIANLPEEVPWYLRRTTGGWSPVALLLFAGHFVVPFLVLLSKKVKLKPGGLLLIAGWLLVFHYLDLFWVVVPSAEHRAPMLRWTDLSALLGIGGTAVTYALLLARGERTIAVRDPYLLESLEYTQP